MVFVKLMVDLPQVSNESMVQDSLHNEPLFLISSLDPWYVDAHYILKLNVFVPNYWNMTIVMFSIKAINIW